MEKETAERKPNVITIAASEKQADEQIRVAAYARVSSASDDQLNSFAAQQKYFRELIAGKPNWQLVDIYADEGITGTSMGKREEFKRLLSDCKHGKVDKILVKSISRFARNTKECLEIIRELKIINVSVCFEEQNIDTAVMNGEMMTTVFASIAQEESKSISQNMRWSYQKRMQAGTFITCKAPFGYRFVDGTLRIYEPEAEWVRQIFDWYLDGESCDSIAGKLTAAGIPSRDGKPYWQRSSVLSILHNEKYAGDSLLQKRYATDTFPTKKVRNKGERDQYFITDSHDAILDRETFDAASKLLGERGKRIMTERVESPFSGKIYCGECGTLFKRKYSKGKTFWICRKHDGKASECPVSQIPEGDIEKAFLRLYFNLRHGGAQILPNLYERLQSIRMQSASDKPEVTDCNNEIRSLQGQVQMLGELKKQSLIDPDIFISKTDELTKKIRKLKQAKEVLLSDETDAVLIQTRDLVEFLETAPSKIGTFDPLLFDTLVDRVIIGADGTIKFRLRNGLELNEKRG